jgi:RimJ/RimL family protein N-acetyltransferase
MSVQLTPFRKEHIRKTFRWVSNAKFRNLFLMRGVPNWDHHQAYFLKTLKDSTQKVFAVLYGKKHVGNCGFKNMSDKDKSAELWVYVGDFSMHGKGIGSAAVQKLIQWGIKKRRMRVITLHVAIFNENAIHLYEKFGFKRIALNKQDIKIWGDRTSHILKMKLITRLSGTTTGH